MLFNSFTFILISFKTVTYVDSNTSPFASVMAVKSVKVKFEVTAVTQGYVRVYAYVGASGTFSNIFSSPNLQTGKYES